MNINNATVPPKITSIKIGEKPTSSSLSPSSSILFIHSVKVRKSLSVFSADNILVKVHSLSSNL